MRSVEEPKRPASAPGAGCLRSGKAGGFGRDLIHLYDYYTDKPKLLESEIEQLGELMVVQAELVIAPIRIKQGERRSGFIIPLKRAKYLQFSTYPAIRKEANRLHREAKQGLDDFSARLEAEQRLKTLGGIVALGSLVVALAALTDSGDSSDSDFQLEQYKREEERRKQSMNTSLAVNWATVGKLW